jgi:hypothetical protein
MRQHVPLALADTSISPDLFLASSIEVTAGDKRFVPD